MNYIYNYYNGASTIFHLEIYVKVNSHNTPHGCLIHRGRDDKISRDSFLFRVYDEKSISRLLNY